MNYQKVDVLELLDNAVTEEEAKDKDFFMEDLEAAGVQMEDLWKMLKKLKRIATKRPEDRGRVENCTVTVTLSSEWPDDKMVKETEFLRVKLGSSRKASTGLYLATEEGRVYQKWQSTESEMTMQPPENEPVTLSYEATATMSKDKPSELGKAVKKNKKYKKELADSFTKLLAVEENLAMREDDLEDTRAENIALKENIEERKKEILCFKKLFV